MADLKEINNVFLSDHGFEISKTLVNGNVLTGTPTIYIDDAHKKWAILKNKRAEPKIYDFSDILDFEVLENGGSIMKGHAGSAIIGGLTFGVVGAIAGGSRKKKVIQTCKSMNILITINNSSFPNVTIPLISSEVKTDSLTYKSATKWAQNITSILTVMQNQGKQIKSNESNNIDIAEQIKKLSDLKEQGILTEDEFTAKKKQLLGI